MYTHIHVIYTYTAHTQPDLHFMKKIPPGSEASNVLVGEVEFLNQPIIAFVRLSKGVMLGDITEVHCTYMHTCIYAHYYLYMYLFPCL